jgi:hypothetical protein
MNGITDLKQLAEALRDLHRRLAEAVRRGHERQRQEVVRPEQFLHLLTSDPRFAGLHVLSELIVDFDVFLRADPYPDQDEAAALRAEVERLIGVDADSASFGAFAQHYAECVKEDSRVAAADAYVRRLIRRLPEAAEVNERDVLRNRHHWSEVRRHGRAK